MAIGRIPEPGTGIPESIVDAKGDLVTATAADTPARLAVGTNEHRLVAASGETTGLKYVADTTNYAIAAKGDLLVGTAADTLQALSVGTNGHTLVADSGEATGLKWAAPAAAGFVGCYLYNSAAQNVGNLTNTVLTFNSESFDTDGFHSTSTNTSRITIPSGKGGKYLFVATIIFASNSTGRRALKFVKNGADYYEMIEDDASSGEFACSASLILNLVATDYVELIASQNSGGNLDAKGGEKITKFQAVYLGA